MFKRIVFFLLLTSIQSSYASNCELNEGLAKIESLNINGNFKEALVINNALLVCENLTEEDKIQLLIWKFRLNRNRYNAREADAALSEAKELLEARGEALDFEFRLLVAESRILRNDTAAFNALLKQLHQEIFDVPAENHLEKARYYFLTAYQHSDAIPVLLKALNHLEELDDPPTRNVGLVLRTLGNMHAGRGDFAKAKDYYTREMAVYQKKYPADHFDVSVGYYHFGNLSYEQLEYEIALENYLKAYEVWNLHYKPAHPRMKGLNEAIGDMYWELKQPEKALEFFNKSTPYAKQINNDSSEQTITSADSLLQQGNYSAALNYYQEAFKWREKTYGENHMLTGACKNFVARAVRSSGDVRGALTNYQEAIDILVDEMDKSSWYDNPSKTMRIKSAQYLLESLAMKGELLKELFSETQNSKDLIGALAAQEAAIEVLELIKNQQMSEGSKEFWTGRTLAVVENGIDTALQLYEVTDDSAYLNTAFDFSERSKTLLLLASLYDQNVDKFVNVPAEILAREKELKHGINDYFGKLESEEKRCAEVRLKMVELYKGKLRSLQDEYDLFIKTLKTSYPDYYNLKYSPETVSIEQIQKDLLDKETQLISYFTGENSIFVFAMMRDSLSLRKIDNAEKVFTTTQEFFSIVSAKKAVLSNPSEAFQKYVSASSMLYDILVKDELAQSSASRLFIVPDGSLSYIPFDIILTETPTSEERNYKELPYLLSDYAITYSPSVSTLVASHQIQNKEADYFGFAPSYGGQTYTDARIELANLQYNVPEVAQAAELLNGQHWSGSSVTEDLFKENSQNAGIIHLATHGMVEDEHPLLSKLYFAKHDPEIQDANDGMLHSYEIYNLAIPAQLVILSACNTAVGKWSRGEGILSLERAFQYAGSASLVSTLWTADDESSAKLTTSFLTHLKDGNSKDVALQMAKLDFLQSASPEKLHPYYWSNFKLTGNTQALSKTTLIASPWFIGGGILAVFALLFAVRKRKKAA